MISIKDEFIDGLHYVIKAVQDRLGSRLLPSGSPLSRNSNSYATSSGFESPFMLDTNLNKLKKYFIYGISSFSRDTDDVIPQSEKARERPNRYFLVVNEDN